MNVATDDVATTRTGASHAASIASWLLPLSVGAYVVAGAYSVRTLPTERYFYGVVLLVALGAALRSIKNPLVGSYVRGCALAVVGGILLYLVASLTQPSWEPSYVFGDMSLALLPVAVLLAAAARPDMLRNNRPMVMLLGLLLVAAVEARAIGMLGSRHEPPSSLLICGVWYATINAVNNGWRAVSLLPTGLVGVLCYTSGYRTHLIIWVVAPVLILLLTKGARVFARATVALLVLAGLLWVAGVHIPVTDSFRQSRFETIASGRADESLQTRLLELQDVEGTIRTEWPLEQAITGYGFGGSYQPVQSYIRQNVGSDGRVHNIHMGPALVFFRFGVLGLIAVGYVLWTALRVLRATRTRTLIGEDSPAVVNIVAISIFLFLLEFLMLNVTVQPALAYCVGMLLCARGLLSKRGAEAGERE